MGEIRLNGGDDTTFAYQGIGGLDMLLTDRVSVFAEYKALVLYDGAYYRNHLSHMVGGGVRFAF